MDSSTNLEFITQDSCDQLLQPGWQHAQAPVCHRDWLLQRHHNKLPQKAEKEKQTSVP